MRPPLHFLCVALALALGVACSSDSAELFVDVRTDLAPAADFDQVLTELYSDETRPPERSTMVSVSAADDFVSGHRVAELSEVPTDAYTVRVTLLLGGSAIASERLFVQLDGDRAVTIEVGTSSPDAGTDSGADTGSDVGMDASDSGPTSLGIMPATAEANLSSELTFSASGGEPPYTFSIVSGAGEIDGETGVLRTPNYGQTVVVRATDADTSTADATVTVGGSHLFAFGGYNGTVQDTIFRTTDGTSWDTYRMPGERGETVCVVFNDAMFLVGGYFPGGGNTNTVIYSNQGTTGSWFGAGTLPDYRGWGGAVVFEGRIIYAGGRSRAETRNTDVYASDDGMTWSKIGDLPEPTTWGGLAVFNGMLFHLGGNHEDGASDVIWTSDDGAAWTVATERLPDVRGGGGVVVFRNALWYLGGENAPGDVQDQIWTSDDGLAWRDTGFTLPRGFRNAAVTVHDDRIWIVGGNGGGYLDTAYYSSDGMTYTAATSLPSTVDRFAAVSFTPVP